MREHTDSPDLSIDPPPITLIPDLGDLDHNTLALIETLRTFTHRQEIDLEID